MVMLPAFLLASWIDTLPSKVTHATLCMNRSVRRARRKSEACELPTDMHTERERERERERVLQAWVGDV
jgi:hypothetical protein